MIEVAGDNGSCVEDGESTSGMESSGILGRLVGQGWGALVGEIMMVGGGGCGG